MSKDKPQKYDDSPPTPPTGDDLQRIRDEIRAEKEDPLVPATIYRYRKQLIFGNDPQDHDIDAIVASWYAQDRLPPPNTDPEKDPNEK